MLRLMGITDGMQRGADDLVRRVVSAVEGGATCVQIRLKDESARTIAALTRDVISAVNVPVFVNDRFDIALAAGAHGVHLGADDIAVDVVRRLVPPGFIIGTSVGCDDELQNAADADYVGIGPVYATGSKNDAGAALGLEGFALLQHSLPNIPAVGIGGICADNAAAVIAAGATGVAVISALFRAPDPAQAAREMSRAIGS